MATINEDSRRPNAGIGDLVLVDGYGSRIYRVDAINYEHYIDEDFEHSGFYYDVTRVMTEEAMVADSADVSVISPSDNAEKYLRMNFAKPGTADEPATVDDLLLELSDALELRRRFGDHEDSAVGDRKYALKVCGIKAQLRDRVEG